MIILVTYFENLGVYFIVLIIRTFVH